MRRTAAAVIATAAVALVVVAVVNVSAGSSQSRAPRVAFVTGGAGATSQVWVADLRDRTRRLLGPGQQPLLSPEGSVVAVSSTAQTGSALTLYTIGGTVIRRFFDAAQATAVAQAWSPDSRYLAVVLTSRDPASAARSGLAVIDTRTLAASILARGPIYGASFAPNGSDRIAYALAASPALEAPVDIEVAAADGAGAQQITHDGLSLYPVWGPGGIAFDREMLRPDADPAYEIWLMNADGSRPVQLTDLSVPPLMDGLVPVAFAGDDGAWLLAQYEGLDTSRGWAIAVPSRRARPLTIAGSGRQRRRALPVGHLRAGGSGWLPGAAESGHHRRASPRRWRRRRS